MRQEAQESRWYWFLPVEAGYAASLHEVRQHWTLTDVGLMLDRLDTLERQRQKAKREAEARSK